MFIFSSPFKEAERAVDEATNALIEYQTSKNQQYLTAAIVHYHHAYETSGVKHNQFPDILINYAALLNKQDGLSGGKSHLDQVIDLLERALAVMAKRSSRTPKYGILLNNLGQAYLDQYRESRKPAPLASAKKTFEQARLNFSSPGSSTYVTSLIGSATALWTECELQPPGGRSDLSQLNEAIKFLDTAQERSQHDAKAQAECLMHLAAVYDLRYRRGKDPVDLDQSIKFYADALAKLDSQNPNRAPTLFNLAKQQFERHMSRKETSNLVDYEAAEASRDAAVSLIAHVPEADDLLKKKLAVLTEHMTSYAKRGHTYASISSESSEDAPSRQGTMASGSEPAEYSNHTWSSSGPSNISGHPYTTEPAPFESTYSGTLAFPSKDTEKKLAVLTKNTETYANRAPSYTLSDSSDQMPPVSIAEQVITAQPTGLLQNLCSSFASVNGAPSPEVVSSLCASNIAKQAHTTEPFEPNSQVASGSEDTRRYNLTPCVHSEKFQQTKMTPSGGHKEARTSSEEKNTPNSCADLGQPQITEPGQSLEISRHQQPIMVLDETRDKVQQLIDELDDLKRKFAVLTTNVDLYAKVGHAHIPISSGDIDGTLNCGDEIMPSVSLSRQVEPAQSNSDRREPFGRVNRDQVSEEPNDIAVQTHSTEKLHLNRMGGAFAADTKTPAFPANLSIDDPRWDFRHHYQQPPQASGYYPPVQGPVYVFYSPAVIDHSHHETSYGRFNNYGEHVTGYGSSSAHVYHNENTSPHCGYNAVNDQLNEQMNANNNRRDLPHKRHDMYDRHPEGEIYDELMMETEDTIEGAPNIPSLRGKGILRSNTL